MSYGQKYVLYFKSFKDQSGEIKFYKKNYYGSINELIGTATPLTDNFKGKDDEIETPIKVLNWSIRIMDLDVGTYDEFYTSDQRMFQIKVYIDSQIVCNGWINVDYLERPLFTVREDLIINVNDGIASLKTENFRKINETNFGGYITPLQAIEACLYRTDLELGLKENANFYEINMDDDNEDSPLDQVYFQARAFQNDEKEFDSCYEVLEQILNRFNCELMQHNGYWVINSINQRKLEHIRRIYSYSSGSLVYNTTETHDPLVELDGVNSWFWDMPMISLKQAWKKFIIDQDYGRDTNLFKWYSERLITGPYYIQDTTVVLPNIYEGDSSDNECTYNLGFIAYSDLQYLKIKFNFQGNFLIPIHLYLAYFTAGKLYELKPVERNGVLYGEWVTHYGGIIQDGLNSSHNTEIISDAIPDHGEEPQLTLNIEGPGGLGLAHPGRATFWDENDFSISLETIGNWIKNIKVETIINENNVYVPDVLELKLGDIPEEINMNDVYKGALYLDTGNTPTSLWHLKGSSEEKTLNGLLADEIAVNHTNSLKVINGNMCIIADHSHTFIIDNLLFLIINISHNRYENELSGDFIQIGTVEGEGGFLKLKEGGYIRLKGGGKIKLKK